MTVTVPEEGFPTAGDHRRRTHLTRHFSRPDDEPVPPVDNESGHASKPEPHPHSHDFLAVYEDADAAEAAAERLRAEGVDDAAIATGRPRDHDLALRAEMRDEVTNSWIAPQASFVMTKEGTRGFLVTLAILNAAAILIATPFAFIEFGGLTFWTRWIIVVGSVVAMVSVIALVAGPAVGTRRPDEPMAAHRGTTLRVATDDHDAIGILQANDPIRIDEVTPDDRPVGPVATEEDDAEGSSLVDEATKAADDLATNIETDDVHPADPRGVDPPV